jgi:hypothetical protein
MSVVPFIAQSPSIGLHQWIGWNVAIGGVAIILVPCFAVFYLHEPLLRSDSNPEISLAIISLIKFIVGGLFAFLAFREGMAMYPFQAFLVLVTKLSQAFRIYITGKIPEASLYAELDHIDG